MKKNKLEGVTIGRWGEGKRGTIEAITKSERKKLGYITKII